MTIIYDGDGNRTQETVAGVVTRYLTGEVNPTGYVQVMAELSSTNQILRGYEWGLQLAAVRDFTVNPGGIFHYYGLDGHGSVRFLTDSTGAVTDTYDYDAFGNLIASTGSTVNNYLFAGEQFDPALGIYYNRATYYDQRQGRFWTMDTWEGHEQIPSSLQKYLYAAANPVTNMDRSGFESLAEINVTQGISETLDTISNPERALQVESKAKVADIYLAFGLGDFGGGGKWKSFLPIPHMYVYANMKLLNDGQRFDVGINTPSSDLERSMITTVPGFVSVTEATLASVEKDSLFLRKWASLSVLELGLWRAGMPALATRITTGINTILAPAFDSEFPIPYAVLGEGGLNCITFSLAAVGIAKALENAPI